VGLAGAEDSKCTCGNGTASYLWLKCPKAAPGDPDPCPAVRDGLHIGGRMPREWNDACIQAPRMECFLRRHGAAWRIQCSLCAAKPCCPFPNWSCCPRCTGAARAPIRDARFAGFVEAQRKIGASDGIEVATSPHFVAISDIKSLRLVTAQGGKRRMGKHELLHLYLQRAELARRDFEQAFGSAYHERSVLVLAADEKVRARFAQSYFGHVPTCLRRGYNSTKTVAQGWAINGWCTVGEDDDELHFRMRHMLGHLFMSTYMRASPMEKYLPKWIDAGAAHWLCKLHPRAKNYAHFCLSEGKGRTKYRVSAAAVQAGLHLGSGKRWAARAKKIARKGPRADPVEAMFSASTVKQTGYEFHIRAWSWFDWFLREDRANFVDFVRGLRRAEEPRAGAKRVWNQPPEVVDERWRHHLLGHRKLEKASEKKTKADTATVTDLKAIRRESDMRILAGRIRGLERCETKAIAETLVGIVDKRASDRVHEVVAMVLARTTDEKVLEYLRGDGYQAARKMGRAILCRAFGEQKNSEAASVLRDALRDKFWLTRAHAARSLAQIRDRGSIPALAELAATASVGKVRIAAMDALALFGAPAKGAAPRLAANLTHRAWQVKVATCQVLARLGNEAVVDALIERIDLEGGRIHDEIRRTLGSLTGMRREWRAETWRKWWEKQKRFKDLERKSRKALGIDEGKPGQSGRYAQQRKPPTYYGIKVFARTVGYVLDISGSMKQGFELSKSWQKILKRTYTGRTRIDVCKEEFAYSVGELDPRTRFNIYFFNAYARAWQSTPVAAGALGGNGVSAVRNAAPAGETNYYGVLKLVLGEREGWNPRFADTPDTLLFLTDGLPTAGEITKADELLAWFGERNRFARLKVHVIALGRAGVDPELLRELAERNGGTFVHLTGTH